MDALIARTGYTGEDGFEILCAAGDGPAVFVVLIIGAIIVGLALWVEIDYQPPYWVHLAIWAPAILGGCLGALRPAKAILIALQFKHRVLAFDDKP